MLLQHSLSTTNNSCGKDKQMKVKLAVIQSKLSPSKLKQLQVTFSSKIKMIVTARLIVEGCKQRQFKTRTGIEKA